MALSNGGGCYLANSRYSVVTLNGAPPSSSSDTAGGGRNNGAHNNGVCDRLVFLGNIYSRKNQTDKVTEC